MYWEQALGFRVQGLGFGVQGLGFAMLSSGSDQDALSLGVVFMALIRAATQSLVLELKVMAFVRVSYTSKCCIR